MKRIYNLVSLLLFIAAKSNAQSSGAITVDGDIDKFYPVTFYDGNWSNNKPTTLFIGRSSVHTNSSWRGSIISQFEFHLTHWGNGAHYINALVRNNGTLFIAGWRDASSGNNDRMMIIWLKGGGTTYYYNTYDSALVNPVVYDGVANSLPFNESNGPSHSYKTSVDDYVNQYGWSFENKVQIQDDLFVGDKVGIGTTNPSEALSVNGNILCKKVKVTQTGWPDFVFEKEYDLKPLSEIENYIRIHKHLPGVPDSATIACDNLDIGEMNRILLLKVEEMTLHLIALKKENDVLLKNNLETQKRLEQIEKRLTEK